jgi:hypothetical protein
LPYAIAPKLVGASQVILLQLWDDSPQLKASWAAGHERKDKEGLRRFLYREIRSDCQAALRKAWGQAIAS